MKIDPNSNEKFHLGINIASDEKVRHKKTDSVDNYKSRNTDRSEKKEIENYKRFNSVYNSPELSKKGIF